MKNRSSKTTVEWEVDPAGQWVTKRESDAAGTPVRTVLYRPSQTGTVAAWWNIENVDTRGIRSANFERATAVFEPVERSFSAILDEARAGVPYRPTPTVAAISEPIADPVQIPPALRYLDKRP